MLSESHASLREHQELVGPWKSSALEHTDEAFVAMTRELLHANNCAVSRNYAETRLEVQFRHYYVCVECSLSRSILADLPCDPWIAGTIYNSFQKSGKAEIASNLERFLR